MNRLTLLLPAFFLIFSGLSSCGDTNVKDPEDLSDVEFKRTGPSALIRLEAEPDRLTPVLTTNNYSDQVFNNIFMPLMEPEPSTLKFVPVLVKDQPEVRDISEGPHAGGIAYTFEIHEEAVWDDGMPVTGHDYVFMLKVILNPQVQAAPFRPYISLIKQVEIDPADPRRFTVFTGEKFFQSLQYITNTFYLLPRHIYDPEGYLKDIPLDDFIDPEKIEQLAGADDRLQLFADQFSDQKYGRDPQFVSGCGPYRLEGWESGQQIILKKKENWWGDALADRYPALRAHPRELVFKPIPDATTSIAAMKAEEIDAAYNLDPNGFEELEENEFTRERFDFYTPPLMVASFVAINCNNPKLNDRRVRRAIAHAIDAQEIIDNVYNGYGERLSTPVLPNFDYVEKGLPPYEFNIERSRELLAEAGWEDSDNNGIVDKEINGQRVELSLEMLITANRETARNVALLIQDNARRAGINIEPTPHEASVMFDRLRKRDYELGLPGRAYPSPLWNPQQNFHTAVGDNRTGFGNAQSDALIDQIVVTLDEEKRNELYRQLQRMIYEEVPEIQIFVPTARIAVHKRFSVETTPLYPGFVPSSMELREAFRQEALN